MKALACPYCDRPAELVTGAVIYPHRPDLFAKRFWRCQPCGAHVGCHDKGAPVRVAGKKVTSDGTLPLGRLANAELRRAKTQAHAAFDPIWKTRRMGRNEAYAWLACQLQMPVEDCHIGMLDVDGCGAVVAVCRALEVLP